MAEALRASESFFRPPMSALYATYQGAFVRDNFSALLAQTVIARKLAEAATAMRLKRQTKN